MASRYGGGNLYQRDGARSSQPYYDGGGGGSSSSGANGRLGTPSMGYRASTPNASGQVYNHAVLDELESQNDAHVSNLISKVKVLKDITEAIGVEVRDSTSMMAKMNDNFEDARVRVKGTMKRMLRMAERSGVSWKIWLLFIFAVFSLFGYVWLF